MSLEKDDNQKVGNLAADLRAVYGAYQFLRDHDLAAISSTSRRLHEADLPALAARVRDEVGELRGVIEGTHGHGGGADDIVLEASQCLYWTFVLAVAAGDAYQDLLPHLVLTGTADDAGAVTVLDDAARRDTRITRRDEATGQGEVTTSPAETTIFLDDAATLTDSSTRRAALRAVLATVGALCRRGGVEPRAAVARDHADLKARPYLDAYWTALAPPSDAASA